MNKTITWTILFVITLIVLVSLAHAHKYFKEPKNIDIIQFNQVREDLLEDSLKHNLPIVLRNSIELPKINLHHKITGKYITQSDPALQITKSETTEQSLKDILDGKCKGCIIYRNNDLSHLLPLHFKQALNKLKGSLGVESNVHLYAMPADITLLPRRFNFGRNWIYVTQGECLVQLFHPKHARALSIKQTTEPQCELFGIPPVSQKDQPKYTEVILRPGQALYIPHMWVYGFRTTKPVVIVNFTSNDPFSFLFSRIQCILKNKTST
jgi:hypothetical protein